MPVLGDISPFPWLESTQQKTDGRRNGFAADELSHRAGLMYRLGFSQKDATARLCERIAWEFDPKCGAKRPASLSDEAVAKIVADTYARRPK